MKRLTYLFTLLLIPLGVSGAEPVRVASLNPIVSDIIRQVGGKHVVVVDLMPMGADPHRFYPSPSHLKDAAKSQVVFAAGKGLEGYLEEFKESLGVDIPLVELGDSVPSIETRPNETFVCCPAHAKHRIDPHWWSSIRNVQRAAKAVARELGEINPAHKDVLKERADTYSKRLDVLHRWVRKELALIPRRDRELTTAHAAFGYFCTEFGMRSITVQGLTTEDDPHPAYLKHVIKTLRKEKVKAVFPEEGANPSVIAGLVNETGVKVGGELFPDNLPAAEPTYEGMIRHNVNIMVEALAPPKE